MCLQIKYLVLIIPLRFHFNCSLSFYNFLYFYIYYWKWFFNSFNFFLSLAVFASFSPSVQKQQNKRSVFLMSWFPVASHIQKNQDVYRKKSVSAERPNTYNRNGSLNPNRQNCLRIKVKLSSSHKQTSYDTSTEKIRYDSLLNNPFQNVPKYQLLIQINYLTELMIFW